FKFHEGKVEEFKRLSAQAMEIVRTKDTGTLQYDTYFNDDQSECIVLARFRDSEALIEHAAHLGDLTEAILATVSVVHGELLGDPSAELRAKLAGSEVRFSSRPTCRCRHRSPAWARLPREPVAAPATIIHGSVGRPSGPPSLPLSCRRWGPCPGAPSFPPRGVLDAEGERRPPSERETGTSVTASPLGRRSRAPANPG
ncbi:MAG TPA: antibiotic biosynthesis monooxygenase, partial [Actinomycetota bacterium]